jgi:hypothetical protein
MTDEELRDASIIMRQRAQRVGPMHAFWDTILDIEMMLAGMPTQVSRDVLVAQAEEALKGSR